MEEIKMETKPIKNEVREISLTEKVDLLMNAVQTGRIKKLRLGKAKVGRGKVKKGYIGVLRIDENGNIAGEKQKVEDFSFKLKNGTYHATDGREVLMWQGKYPVVFQPTWKLNPINFFKRENETNETYGQKYVMAKMLKDTIVAKKGAFGGIIIWILIIGAVIWGITKLF